MSGLLKKKPTTVEPHYAFEIERNNFIIKIANSPEEILKAQKLRHQVFSQVASGFETTKKDAVDIDDYDNGADHLIVMEKNSKAVVGTYRFLLSDKVSKHYSAREFDIAEFLKQPGRKMELGRASVDPTARAGVIITLLWRGIAEYLKLSKADYLFGCSSMWDVSTEEIIKLCQIFKSKNLVSGIQALPLPSHWPLGFSDKIEQLHEQLKPRTDGNDLKMQILYDQHVPTLVKTYIHVGSKFTVPPAYDPKLKTFEFFGYVKTENINPAFRKKYLS